jgi:hypothetical protein
MTCLEFERDLPECVEGKPSPEQQAHLNSCPTCSGLLLDLNSIASQAKMLSAAEEPSAAVWNALEQRLRSEGLIQRSEPVYLPAEVKPSFMQRWRAAWLVPVAAALVAVAVVKLYHPANIGDNSPVAKQAQPAAPAAVVKNASAKRKPALSHEDQQWLDTVAARPPAQLAKFRTDLDQANAFIEDAQQSLQQDPNDVYMQQMLMNAYEQKQMLYELVVDDSSH